MIILSKHARQSMTTIGRMKGGLASPEGVALLALAFGWDAPAGCGLEAESKMTKGLLLLASADTYHHDDEALLMALSSC